MSGTMSAIELPERFAIGALPALKDAVDERRAAGTPVVLDATAVRSVDSAALQFLIVCRGAHMISDAEPMLVGAGDALEKALDDIGASGLFAS